MLRRVFRSVMYNYLGAVVTYAGRFLLTPFILHALGPTRYGLWILVGSVIGYGSLLEFGVTSAVVKYVAEYRARGEVARARDLIGTALSLSLGFGLLAIALSALLAGIFPALFPIEPGARVTARWLVFLAGSGLGVSLPCSLAPAVLRGMQRFDLVNILSITGTLVSIAGIAAVLLAGGGLIGMALVGIVVPLAMQTPSIVATRRLAPGLSIGRPRGDREMARTIIRFGSSIFLIHTAGQIHTETDEIVIAANLPLRAVTPYALARRLSTIPQVLTDQFLQVLLPLASELHATRDDARLRALYITATRLTLAIFLPIGCITVILARTILGLWVGAEYTVYADLVLILTLASLFDTSQWPAAVVLQGMNRHRPVAIGSLCSGCANLALSVLLVQRFGIRGVALGTLIPTAIECMGFVLPYTLRVTGVTLGEITRQALVPGILPALPMMLLFALVQRGAAPSSLRSFILVVGVGLVVYAVAYVGLGARKSERARYRRIVESILLAAKDRGRLP